MDRGYVDFERLYALHARGALFVIRAKSNLKFRRRASRVIGKSAGLRCDQGIVLTGVKTSQSYPQWVRPIGLTPIWWTVGGFRRCGDGREPVRVDCARSRGLGVCTEGGSGPANDKGATNTGNAALWERRIPPGPGHPTSPRHSLSSPRKRGESGNPSRPEDAPFPGHPHPHGRARERHAWRKTPPRTCLAADRRSGDEAPVNEDAGGTQAFSGALPATCSRKPCGGMKAAPKRPTP